jgi:hypothetical protein
MPLSYLISQQALSFIEMQIDRFVVSDFKDQYFPAVMWNSGGSIDRGSEKLFVPEAYALVYIKKSDLPRMIAIPSSKFGFIGLRLSPADALEDKTILDYNQKTFFMR